MTLKANTPERDEAIRKLAGELSAVIQGQHIDIAISAAALLIVVQCEPYKNADLDRYAATKLRQVADVLDPITEVRCGGCEKTNGTTAGCRGVSLNGCRSLPML